MRNRPARPSWYRPTTPDRRYARGRRRRREAGLRPVRLLGEVAVDCVDVDTRGIVVELVATRQLSAHRALSLAEDQSSSGQVQCLALSCANSVPIHPQTQGAQRSCSTERPATAGTLSCFVRAPTTTGCSARRSRLSPRQLRQQPRAQVALHLGRLVVGHAATPAPRGSSAPPSAGSAPPRDRRQAS